MKGLIDIHCHILPYADDGASNMKESIQMMKMEAADGVSDIILTPHHRVGMFETRRILLDGTFSMLQWECENAGINICLHKGCEYHVASWMIEDFSNGLWPTLAGTRYVLIEFDEDEDYLTLKGRIRSLHEAGFYPIVAHAERISCLAEKVERFSELNRMGARIQITAGAILGENGRQTANLCMGLIEKDYVQYVATDAHHTDNRKPNLGECFRFVSKQVGIMKARELMVFNPKKICGKEN